MTDRDILSRLAWVVGLGGLLITLALVLLSFSQQADTRAGCMRGVQAHAANASGWETAARTRWAAWVDSAQPADLAAAIGYEVDSDTLRGLIVDCDEKFPPPIRVPW